MYHKAAAIVLFMLFLSGHCYAQSGEIGLVRKAVFTENDTTRKIDAMNRLAMLLYEKNIDSTFFYAGKARQLAERANYEKGRADALNNLGVVFDIKGNFQLSLKYYHDGYQRYVRLNDSANCVQAMMNIAMVYKELGKDTKAIGYYNRALTQGKTLRKDSILSLVIYNYLLQFPDRFSPDARSEMIGQAKQVATRYRDNRLLLAIDQLVADDLIAAGKRQAGLAMLDSAISRALKQHLQYAAMDILIGKGDHLAKSDAEAAADVYRQGLALATGNGYLFYQQTLARKLFELYSVRGNSQTAFKYSQQLISFLDEQERLNNASGIDYVDYALKEQALTTLGVKEKYQRWLLWLALAICLLVLLVLGLIYRSWQRTRVLNRQVMLKNEQMQKTLVALEQSQADNTRMMKIVAHDLRNPVGGIFSIAGMMLEETGRTDDDLMMINLIRTSASNSLELVSDLLQVHTRAEELHKEQVDLDQMLHYCVDLLSNQAAAKGQRIELKSRKFIIMASREKLWRVVSNLVTNAIKFSPTGAVIHVVLKKVDGNARIEVIDHGIGIPAHIGDKIFDMFTEAKRTGTAGEQAFGLGLAICRQIAEAHGGRIWYKSGEDRGTTFFLQLPALNNGVN